MDKSTEHLLKGNGYRYCQLDVQEILLELMTEERREIFVEIDQRIKEKLAIRELSGFDLNYEDLKKLFLAWKRHN